MPPDKETLTSVIFALSLSLSSPPSPLSASCASRLTRSYGRLPAHTNIVQAKAMEDRSPSKLEVLYELGECDFTKHSWGHPRSSLCEVMG